MDKDMSEFAGDTDVEELREVDVTAEIRLRRHAKLAAISLATFATGCGMVYLLSDKGPYHSQWSHYGRAIVYFAEGGLLLALYSVTMLWTAWKLRRENQRDLRELLEDRYGVEKK